MDGGGEVRLFRLVTTARTISWIVFVSLVPDMLMLESEQVICTIRIRAKMHRFRSPRDPVPERPAVDQCTTSGSVVLARVYFRFLSN